MDIIFKGTYLSSLRGKETIATMQALLAAKDWLTTPELNKLTGAKNSHAAIQKLRKLHRVQIDVDDSNKARHKFKIKEGYRLS